MVKSKQIAIEQLKHDEGLRLYPYTCTANKVTIGYGRNLEDNGISALEAEQMLQSDTQVAMLDAKKFVGEVTWNELSDVRQACLINMAFNLGLPTLKKFKKFKQALQDGDMDEASVQMLASKWAKQVGQRAKRLSLLIKEG
ncbi:glycoside hydrolase family protein [Alphaproteobacteria bacterium]|nr:glycoside hydrolase family protein [Alphaproteobacteria bacterium]